MPEIKISKPAPQNVNNWLKTASKEQAAAYLSVGPAECLELNTLDIETGNFKTLLMPGIRGVIVGKEAPAAEAALAKAEEMLVYFRSQPSEPIDEEDLGIDGEAQAMQTLSQEIGFRLDRILHIGTMEDIGLSADLEEFLSDLDAEYDDPIFADLPFLKTLADEGEIDPDHFQEIAYDNGIAGFIVQVAVCDRTPHEDGRGASIHGSCRSIAYRYGSTFKIAVKRAAEWAEAEIERKMSKGQKAA